MGDLHKLTILMWQEQTLLGGYIVQLSFQALGVFGLCQIHSFIDYVRSKLTKEQFEILFKFLVLVSGAVALLAFGVATAMGSILLWFMYQ